MSLKECQGTVLQSNFMQLSLGKGSEERNKTIGPNLGQVDLSYPS